MTYVESEYIGYDGTRMFMHRWIPPEGKPRASILAIHGLGSHGGDMKNIGEYFVEKGFAVHAPDMRGFGHFTGCKGHVMNFDEYTEDLANIIEQVKDQYPGRLIFPFGASLGGLWVIRYVVTYPKEIDGLILSCPSVSEKLPIGKGTRIAASLLSLLNAKIYFDNGVKEYGALARFDVWHTSFMIADRREKMQSIIQARVGNAVEELVNDINRSKEIVQENDSEFREEFILLHGD